jgi:hypothetical protein
MKGYEKLIYTEDAILIDEPVSTGGAVMHIGEKELMEELAKLVTTNGGDILEIGFGMHLSADVIQSNPNVTSHTIIEVHPEQYERAVEWAKLQKIKTAVILGDWIEILPLSNTKFDGVLHDTHRDPNIPKFLDYVIENCKSGTIVGFFEYEQFDTRLNGHRVKINESDYESIPYKDNFGYTGNQFELKYTTFDGSRFVSNSKLTKLI